MRRSANLAGTMPAEWLSPGSVLSATLLSLDLSSNRLTGSIPPRAGGHFLTANTSTGQATDVVLDPMSQGYGLCGAVPDSMNVSSADGRQLQGTMPAGPCPGIGKFSDAVHRQMPLQALMWLNRINLSQGSTLYT